MPGGCATFAAFGGYSARVSNDLRDPLRPTAPELSPIRRSRSRELVPWLEGTVIVLVIAVLAGLTTAWILASMRAVPGSGAELGTPTPRPTPVLTAAPPSVAGPTAEPTDPPRRTPTPSPLITAEPSPFVHIVQRGEWLSLIAELYGVRLEDIIALNDIVNPNRIQPGQRLLIPAYGTPPSPSA